MNFVTRGLFLPVKLKLLKNSVLCKVIFTKCRFIPFIQSAAMESVLFFQYIACFTCVKSWEISAIEPVVMYDI